MNVALLCDSPDERWPSMDIVGDMLRLHLASPFAPEQILRPIRPLTPNFTLNRILFRFLDYPRWVRRNRSRFDLFHITDHSYSQLAHELPPARTVITCHDIDTFRCVLEPERAPRPLLFRAMTRRILSGLERAAHVACDSAATRDDLARYGVLPPERLSIVPLGYHPACSPAPDPTADARAALLLGPEGRFVDVLHVGSTIARKRIDALLHIVAQTRQAVPNLRLLRVGGPFTAPQRQLASSLGLTDSVVILPFLDRETLAALYRRAALVLLPSDAEGFGLPVTEAMACGAPVLASDLPVLREVGGTAADYTPPGDLLAWTNKLIELLKEKQENPTSWEARRSACLRQAANFTFARYSFLMMNVYNKLL